MMESGYPDEMDLTMIRKWDIKEFPSLLDFIENRWAYRDCITREIIKDTIFKRDILQWSLTTVGWSGNESLVDALLGNQLFTMAWHYQWTRGGHHIFRIDPRNVGYFLVSEYCSEKKVTRQYISKAKDKFEYFKLSQKKIFIRPL